MIYEEFSYLAEIKDPKNPFCHKYMTCDGDDFYIEPVFYTQLRGFKDLYGKEYQRILDELFRVVRRYHHVVFVGVYDHPQTEVGVEYVFYEITDITDPLKIYAEDKSRGSDYGD